MNFLQLIYYVYVKDCALSIEWDNRYTNHMPLALDDKENVLYVSWKVKKWGKLGMN